MPTLAEAVWIARSRGWIPHLSAGVCGGSKALSYIGLAQAAAPPPSTEPQSSTIGVFSCPPSEAQARLGCMGPSYILQRRCRALPIKNGRERRGIAAESTRWEMGPDIAGG